MQSPYVQAFVADQVRNPAAFKAEVHPQDEMFLFDLPIMKGDPNRTAIHYLAQGKRICGNLKQVVDWYFGGFDRVATVLDFACGYGRLTRHLVQEMPAARIWSSDIYAEAVAHQETEFGVHGIVSTSRPEDYPSAGPFDCIYVGSLFSHLPERTFTRWLARLFSMLSPKGMIAFSVLDMSLLPAQIAKPANGYFFSAHSESRSLDTAEYGTTYVTEQFVRAKVAESIGVGRDIRRVPRGLANRQDLYVVTKSRPANGELAFVYGPDGWIENCAVEPDGQLFLKGWAADLNPSVGVRDILLSIDGGVVARAMPNQDRKDVASHFDNPAATRSGWSLLLDGKYAEPSGMLMAKVTNNRCMEHIFSIERVGDLIKRTAQNRR